MRRRIETRSAIPPRQPIARLPTNIHEKKDWNLLFGCGSDGRLKLTNQYPWEEGLKPGAYGHTTGTGRWLTNQYPWEEGLKQSLSCIFGHRMSSYQPISMRRRIETFQIMVWEISSLGLPTNIHEKKDWNHHEFIILKNRWHLTNQYPWEEGLKLAY